MTAIRRFRKVRPEERRDSRFSLTMWHGVSIDVWFRLMQGRWGKVSVSRYPVVASIMVFSLFTGASKLLTRAAYGRRLAAVELDEQPVFIIGHFRSGTTWLHETLAQDPAFCAPTSLACFNPDGFLIGKALSDFIARIFAPSSRPMDNVAIEMSAAQEDEIGIILSGGPSPYQSTLFPCEPPEAWPSPSLSMLSKTERDLFIKSWLGFLRKVQFENPGCRLLLKSPLHTVRVKEILEIFPKAKFVHIVRNPYRVYSSHMKMIEAMQISQGLQDHVPDDETRRQAVLRDFKAFHDVYDTLKGDIPATALLTIRYEDMRSDSISVLREIYEKLQLGEFDAVKELYEEKEKKARKYQTNRIGIDQSDIEDVDLHWESYFETYGYLRARDRPDESL